MTDLPIVHAHGDPARRGRTIGKALAEGIERSVDFTRRYTRRHGLDDRDLEPLMAPYLAAARHAVPRLVAQLEGMAEGAGVRFLDVFAVNAFEELYSVLEGSVSPPAGVVIGPAPPPHPVERCTDVLIRAPGTTILAHNEQWYAGDDGGVAVIVERPDTADEVAIVAPASVGTVPLVGMNARGGALGLMSLSGTDEQVGIPRALLGRDGVEAGDRADAVRRASRARRAGGYSYMYAFRGGDAFTLEVTATREGLIEPAVHTNHALHAAVAEAAEAPSEGSLSRLARTHVLLEGDEPETVQGAMRILGDHGAHGQDICVHPDPAAGDEGSAIQFGMVCDVEAGVMWLAPGQPCSTPFHELPLRELLGSMV
jgi:isopenicillin-N N-acyltransferase-like protein